MKSYLQRFTYWFVALATTAGLYLAAERAGVARWFVAVTTASAIVAGLPIAARWYLRIRQYPQLVERIEELEGANRESSEIIENLERTIETKFRQGVDEGKMQIVGAVIAFSSKPPNLVATTLDKSAINLIGNYDPNGKVRLGARYEVQVAGTGDRRGIVQVTHIDLNSATVTLTCVEETVPAFWDHLRQRALADPSPPRAVRLAPCQLEPIPEISSAVVDDGSENTRARDGS